MAFGWVLRSRRQWPTPFPAAPCRTTCGSCMGVFLPIASSLQSTACASMPLVHCRRRTCPSCASDTPPASCGSLRTSQGYRRWASGKQGKGAGHASYMPQCSWHEFVRSRGGAMCHQWRWHGAPQALCIFTDPGQLLACLQRRSAGQHQPCGTPHSHHDDRRSDARLACSLQ